MQTPIQTTTEPSSAAKKKHTSDADEMLLLSHIINRSGDTSGGDNFVLNLFADEHGVTSAASTSEPLRIKQQQPNEATPKSSVVTHEPTTRNVARPTRQRTLADAMQEVSVCHV